MEGLLEEVLRRENLMEALKRVRSNRGAPGVDGMTVEALTPHLKEHRPRIREELLGERYVPQPIRRYLTAGVMIEGIAQGREEGTPQGGPLSPLLSNVLLDDLDKELERRAYRFCRYADDCTVYVK